MLWSEKEFVITKVWTHGPGHGTAYPCSEPSVIPLSYPALADCASVSKLIKHGPNPVVTKVLHDACHTLTKLILKINFGGNRDFMLCLSKERPKFIINFGGNLYFLLSLSKDWAMDHRICWFANRGQFIKGKQCQHIANKTKYIFVFKTI